MRNSFSKRFFFSASYERGGKIIGHNYVLEITTKPLPEPDEKKWTSLIEERLIRKIHTKDLGLHVDFLKSVKITDLNLLKLFARILKKISTKYPIYNLVLERDSRTKTSLYL